MSKVSTPRLAGKEKAHEAHFDGGVAALAGYVNQMLGSAADFAMCLSDKSNEAGGFKTLIAFEPEVHGQDFSAIGLTAANRKIRVLKQYKYSANPEAHPIRPKELKTIVAALTRSANRANRLENLPPQLVLCTNRPISPKAQISPPYRKIRHELYEAAKAADELASYAAGFGVVNPDELYDGIRRVTNYLFTIATSASHRLTRTLFVENLVGHKHARSIVIADAAIRLRDELQVLDDSTLRLSPAQLAERQVVRTASTDWINDAIVVFVGDGGCGKTTAIWGLLLEAINTQPPKALVQMLISHAQTQQSFSSIVKGWRGIVTGVDSAADDLAMERVKKANPGAPPPIVLLGLDGIDETHLSALWNQTVAQVLSFFWRIHVTAKINKEVPPARLFVSCRRDSDVEHLLPNPTGLGDSVTPLKYVRFEQFTSEELKHLVNDPRVDRRAASLILGSLASDIEVVTTASGPLALSVPPTYLPPSVLDLLKHPIVWRSFTLLDGVGQAQVLDNLPVANDKLGDAFLKWFRERVRHRTTIETDYVPVVLRRVAQSCHNLAEVYPLDNWKQAASAAAGFTEEDAMRLYHESISSGLVQDVPPAGGHKVPHRSWRWKHLFLAEYLKRSSGSNDGETETNI